MEWTAEKIKDLRMRLGFTPSDLARRLSCECSIVRQWELGEVQPVEFHLQQLELLSKLAEACAEELTASPLIEQVLDSDHLGQIDLAAVKARFSENN